MDKKYPCSNLCFTEVYKANLSNRVRRNAVRKVGEISVSNKSRRENFTEKFKSRGTKKQFNFSSRTTGFAREDFYENPEISGFSSTHTVDADSFDVDNYLSNQIAMG